MEGATFYISPDAETPSVIANLSSVNNSDVQSIVPKARLTCHLDIVYGRRGARDNRSFTSDDLPMSDSLWDVEQVLANDLTGGEASVYYIIQSHRYGPITFTIKGQNQPEPR